MVSFLEALSEGGSVGLDMLQSE